MEKSDRKKHPGYIPDNKAVKAKACGCRCGHWCARHAAGAARDAGKTAQEREAASRMA